MQPQTNKNFEMLVQEVADSVDHDNQKAAEIYAVLLRALEAVSVKRQKHQHILGIYFIDLLKFFTGIGFRQYESDLYDDDAVIAKNHVSTRWPYILMREIRSGFTLDQFTWGHDFSNSPSFMKKKFLTAVLKLSNFCRGGAKGRAAITEGTLTLERIKLAHRMRITLDLVAVHEFGKIPITDLEEQLDDLDPVIAEVLTIMDYPFDFNTARSMLRNHIKANCTSGKAPRISPEKILVAGSGCAIENRLMASMARQHDMRVMNIFHGGSYGVQNKPTFNQGEKLLATDTAVFGLMQNLPGDEDVDLIHGRYEKIAPLPKSRQITLPNSEDRLMYVPTSLRGENKRYGPYEDMSDRHYIKLWAMTRAIFGDDLAIKLHPKSNASTEIAPPIITEVFENCLDQADTFIFDYFSTAFTLAAGTNKPIIFLDYGLQNFSEQGIQAIKSRCIYYDMRLELPQSFEAVVEKAKSMTFNHDIIDNFTSAHGQNTIDEAVLTALLS